MDFQGQRLQYQVDHGGPLVFSHTIKSMHPCIWMNGYPQGLGADWTQHWHKLGGISSWKPQLVFSVWTLNNAQARNNTSHGRSQEVSRRLAAGQGKGPRYLSRPIPHREMSAGLRTAGMTWRDSDINYILKMGRRHNESGFYCLPNNRFYLFAPPSFLESLKEINVVKNNF